MRHSTASTKVFTSAVFVKEQENTFRKTIRRAFGYHLFENFRMHDIAEKGNLPPIFHKSKVKWNNLLYFY
jgi:hypothetical protein